MTTQRVAILLAFFAVTSARGVSEDASLKLFERQVADNPGYANGHFGLGRALLAQQQFDSATAALDRALELDPRVRAHYRLGIAYQGKGDTTKAVAMFRRFLSYSSGGRAADDARKRLDALTTKRG